MLRPATLIQLSALLLFAVGFSLLIAAATIRDHGGGQGVDQGDGHPPLVVPNRRDFAPPAPQLEARGTSGAAATDAGECSRIARDVMSLWGGNAADGAVAAALCLGVVHPHSSGIGGGAVAVVYSPPQGTKKDAKRDREAASEEEKRQAMASHFSVLDGREAAPAAAHRDMFAQGTNASSERGPLAVAVPGELKLLWRLWNTSGSGKVTWRELVQPAEALARDGYAVSTALAHAANERAQMPDSHASWLQLWYRNATAQVGRATLAAGDILRFPVLADTLREIGDKGVDGAFYRGPVGARVVRDLRALGGIVTRADLSQYTVKDRPALHVPFGGWHVTGAGPPFSGAVIAQMLRILQNFLAGIRRGLAQRPDQSYADMGEYATESRAAAQALHWVVEASKFGFAHRMGLGDPDSDPQIAQLVETMLSPAHATDLAARLVAMRAFPTPEHYAARELPNGGGLRRMPPTCGTTHLSVVDARGNAVAMTSTVNLWFGATVVSASTGIVLNDEMDDFSKPDSPSNYWGYPPAARNFIAPGKRPLSSMTPTMVTDLRTGELVFIGGAAGGSRIASATFHTMFNFLVRRRSIGWAIDDPRLHHQLLPFTLDHESRFDASVLEVLGPGAPPHRANNTLETRDFIAVCNAITRQHGAWVAASDFRRKGGRPAAY
jgi:gamma-glutamyltranspeptidase / glutathione hydrolase / leukotriene-C4 hydrolase